MSRSIGIKRDLRLSKLETYSNYYFLNFRGFLGQHGDSYDRFLIRMNEMAESLNIVNQVVYKIVKHKSISKSKTNYTNISPHNIIKYTDPNFWNKGNLKNNYNSMESLINHFKH
jgi:NADH:ubiquinone oxidoreductase subunit D